MHCLVTGATGYLGRSLVPALLREGCDVTAHSRQRPLPAAVQARVRALRGDLAGPGASLDLSGVDVLFHLAAIAHHRASTDAYRRINLDMPLALARAASAAGVQRFVFVSSVKAAALADAGGPGGVRGTGLPTEPDDATGDGPQSDRTGSASRRGSGPVLPELDYATSKARAEQHLRAIGESGPMRVVILRPALIYGEDAPGHLALLRRWVDWRLPAPPAGGARSMIGREDLVRLCLRLLDSQGAAPSRLTVTDGEAYTTRRLHEALCRAARRTPLLPSPPERVWCLAARTADALQGIPAGSTWTRLAGTDLTEAEGLEALDFRPRQTFERSLGLVP